MLCTGDENEQKREREKKRERGGERERENKSFRSVQYIHSRKITKLNKSQCNPYSRTLRQGSKTTSFLPTEYIRIS